MKDPIFCPFVRAVNEGDTPRIEELLNADGEECEEAVAHRLIGWAHLVLAGFETWELADFAHPPSDACVHCGLGSPEHPGGRCPASPEDYAYCTDPTCPAAGDLKGTP